MQRRFARLAFHQQIDMPLRRFLSHVVPRPAPRPDDDVPVNQGEWRYERRLTKISFVVVFVALAVGSAGSHFQTQRSDNRIRAAGRNSILNSCRDRVEGRIITAQSNDDLRRGALGAPRSAQERRAQREFLKRTQPAINAQLTRAANPEPEHTKSSGTVILSVDQRLSDMKVIAPIRELGYERCNEAAARFDKTAR
jgi:hypothetical protein